MILGFASSMNAIRTAFPVDFTVTKTKAAVLEYNARSTVLADTRFNHFNAPIDIVEAAQKTDLRCSAFGLCAWELREELSQFSRKTAPA
jgi:hypothetical protein